MAPQEFAALERIETLDKETARRVAQLVIECAASPSLALSAVLDADTSQTTAEQQQQATMVQQSY